MDSPEFSEFVFLLRFSCMRQRLSGFVTVSSNHNRGARRSWSNYLDPLLKLTAVRCGSVSLPSNGADLTCGGWFAVAGRCIITTVAGSGALDVPAVPQWTAAAQLKRTQLGKHYVVSEKLGTVRRLGC